MNRAYILVAVPAVAADDDNDDDDAPASAAADCALRFLDACKYITNNAELSRNDKAL